MRKKLLALLMCATMVLGTAATASAAEVTNTDITNAKAIINQFDADKGAIGYEYDAKTSTITFPTTYVDNSDSANPVKILYTYAFVGDSDGYVGENSIVKVSSDGKTAYQKTNGKTYDIIASLDQNNAVAVGSGVTDAIANPSLTATDLADLNGAVFKSESGTLYYGTVSTATSGTTLGKTQYTVESIANVLAKNTAAKTDKVLSRDTQILTLTAFTAADTGTVVLGKDAAKDSYGVDKDGYIALKDSTATANLLKYSNAIADNYWVEVKKAGDSAITAVAQALADGNITKNAAAVQINFYKTVDSLAGTVTVGSAYETGFKALVKVTAEISDVDVTFKSDWLSRSNAKNANTVFILDPYVTNWTQYYLQTGTVYKVSDLANEKFSTKYIASGVYLFDYVEDASQNDGVSDTDTTASTTAAAASTTAATSPKTGDVAPIAALAVVMMGACGAMVVASKKRA
jgi:hypothetical protein